MFGGQCETVVETAANYGFEDGIEGNDMRGSVYFVGAGLESYNHAYGQGLVAKRGLQVDLAIVDAGVIPADDELMFMVGVLDSMRANTAQYICSCGWSTNNPVAFDIHVRHCRGKSRHDPLSSGERVGAEFCEAPYRY
jgi:hypothetical protein